MIFLILSLIVVGLIVGALGRLVVRGPNRIGFWWTVACGLGGSIVGGIIARLLFAQPRDHRIITFGLEVLVAAVLVSLVSGRRRRLV
jgi:uncharacterized membrane protein YeaQ/YmgE (transglycosylase-associated protein family)